MDEKIKELIASELKSKLSISINAVWDCFSKRIRVKVSYDGSVISEDSIAIEDINLD